MLLSLSAIISVLSEGCLRMAFSKIIASQVIIAYMGHLGPLNGR